MAFFSIDVFAALLGLGIVYFVYALSRAVHNIYFSPLSHIPGSKLAIGTSWYECYHDVWKRGLYYRKVKEMHEAYGW
jgi:hypothetical protein